MNIAYDTLFEELADYVLNPPVFSDLAYETALWCLMDALGCAALALEYKAATQLIGPIVPGDHCDQGVRVMDSIVPLNPVKAAFDFGLLIRWLDYNDTWLAKEWGHPSDNLAAILSLMQYQLQQKKRPFLIKDLLDAMIQAYEIQGVLALNNAFNQVGLDHVLLVKLASAAVGMKILGGTKQQILDVISQVFVDGQALRTYRHAPNTGSRKSWAAGDAGARAVFLSFMTLKGERGYPSALTARIWGFQDALNRGAPIHLAQPLSCYVMENILFKVNYPAEFHAQTAVEAAIQLHPLIKDKIDEISCIEIHTQAAALRIIDKKGPLHNPADRDHCLQYMTAVALIYGELNAGSYEAAFAADPRIDALREKMKVLEDPEFSLDYLDPQKRSISNQLSIYLQGGRVLPPVRVDYPLGHRLRRQDSKKSIFNKALSNFSQHYPSAQAQNLISLFSNPNLPQEPLSILFESLTK